MNLRLWWYRLTHLTVCRDNWLLIVGPDLWNNDYGVTFCHGKREPIADWKRWRTNFRFNIRWPIQIRLR